MPKRYLTTEEKHAALRAKLDRWLAVGGTEAIVQPHANNMLAGPCDGCLALSSHEWLAREVPLMPLSECPHPDQCVGIYSAVLRFD